MGAVLHLSTHSLPMPKPVTVQSPRPLTWCRSYVWTGSMSINASIKAVSLVGCMFYNNAFARNLTLVLESCTHNNSVTNGFRCLCYTQAVIPLSYAAQIPTTRDPDIANVRLSVSRVDHQVPQCSARAFVVVGWQMVSVQMILVQRHIQDASNCTGQGFY